MKKNILAKQIAWEIMNLFENTKKTTNPIKRIKIRKADDEHFWADVFFHDAFEKNGPTYEILDFKAEVYNCRYDIELLDKIDNMLLNCFNTTFHRNVGILEIKYE